jgi:hypothetical protein
LAFDVTQCPSLDWIRDVPLDISVRLVRTTTKHIVVALWCEAADAHVALELGAFDDPRTAVMAAVESLKIKAATEALVSEAQAKPLLVN